MILPYELPTTVNAYFDRFGEVIKKNGGDYEGLVKVYMETLQNFGNRLTTAPINGQDTLIWTEHRLILKK